MKQDEDVFVDAVLELQSTFVRRIYMPTISSGASSMKLCTLQDNFYNCPEPLKMLLLPK